MKRWVLAFCVLSCLTAVPALAAIDNTHHDVKTYTTSTNFTCYACHGYKESQPLDNALGSVGNLCYNRCHRGSGGLTGAIPIATDYPPVGNENGVAQSYSSTTKDKYTTGHKRNWATSFPTTDNLATKGAITSAWPHVSTSATDIQCTGCHDVHNNTYAPFLRAPQTTKIGAGSIGATFCIQCHTGSSATGAGRWVQITAARNGAHPVEVDYSTAATRSDVGRRGRTISVKGTVFNQASLYSTTDLNDPANHYNPGGKLANFTASDNVIGCYTCHAAHIPSQAGTNNLTVVSLGDPAANNETANYLCIACHGPGPTPTGTSNANPGVSSYYHPVNAEAVSTGGSNPNYTYNTTPGFAITVNSGGTDLGSSQRLVCTSCHAPAHGGVANSMILTTSKPTCGSCHNLAAKNAGTAANSHHVYGGSTDYTAAANGGYSNPSYASGNPAVSLADGLSCEDCHVFNGTAHNWN